MAPLTNMAAIHRIPDLIAAVLSIMCFVIRWASSLPRSSYEISHVGQAISKGSLRTGDLVFFNTLHRKFSHVGIYLGGDRFIHAPSSGGRVRTENMRETYWKTHYDGARRITLQRLALRASFNASANWNTDIA